MRAGDVGGLHEFEGRRVALHAGAQEIFGQGARLRRREWRGRAASSAISWLEADQFRRAA